MKSEHQKIIDLLSTYLKQYPDLRFGQALFNLKINEFANREHPEKENYKCRDIHGDEDVDILKRIKGQLLWLEQQKKQP